MVAPREGETWGRNPPVRRDTAYRQSTLAVVILITVVVVVVVVVVQNALCLFVSPYIIGTMRQSTSNSASSADLQLTHHNFRWVLFTVHAEPVHGLLARHLRRRHAAEAADGRGPRDDSEDQEDGLERVVSWLPKVWNHVNRFLEAHCSADVTIGEYCNVT